METTTSAPATTDGRVTARTPVELLSPPDLPTTDGLDTETIDTARAMLIAAWDDMPDERKRRTAKRAARLTELRKVSKCRDSAVSARACADAIRYCVLSAQMRPRAAARVMCIDLQADFGRLMLAIASDPALSMLHTYTRRVAHRRMTSRAEDVAEGALEGDEVSHSQERLAALVLERLDRGTWAPDRAGSAAGQSATPAAAAQVVINISDRSALGVCGNLLQGGRGGVINA